MWVRRLADAGDACGAKAANLARLIAAKLPVPDGFAIEAEAFRAIVGEVPTRDAIGHVLEDARRRIAEAPPDEEVLSCASVLGKLAVRSSATIEDGAGGSAAGVFASSTNVPARDVWDAVRAVWTSALTSLAVTYARGREIAMGVIVQRYVPGERVTVYTRPKITVQRGEYVREYGRDDVDPIVALALRAEAAIGATDGADVELVVDRHGEPWLVQARPIVHAPPPETRVPPPPALYARLVADERQWTWDVAHNPDPLSPAQAGLVERVRAANIAPWSMSLVAGYLYTAPRVPPPVVDIAHFDDRVAAIEARFAELVDDSVPLDVEAAITRYLAFYDVWANELAPLVAAARSTEVVTHRPSSVEATLRAAAHGMIDEATAIARLAPLAPTWDVAVPTFGERPEVIRAAIERARALPPPSTITDASTSLARAAADLAERDDLWFAKAQWLVRRALLARGRQLGIADDDICWLSLDDLATELDLDDARRRASAAKAVHARASKFAMPLVIDHDGPRASTGTPLRGHGSGARHVSGRVVRFASLASAVAVSSGDVIVARAITPALAVFVVGCAAIVSETGGPLDHGAAIARELGIPFVVGCNDAWSLLRDGMRVTLDENLVIPTRN